MADIRFLSRLAQTPDVPTQIYRLAPAQVDTGRLRKTAQALGMAGSSRVGAVEETQHALTYREGAWVLTLYRASGGLRWEDEKRWQMDDGASKVEFSDDDAVEMAREVVGKYDLAPMDELRLLKVSHLHVGSVEVASGDGEERIIDAGVAFGRQVAGVPVEGPGGKLIVFLDAKGEMTGAHRIWRDIQDVYRPVDKLRPPGFAEKQLARAWASREDAHVDVADFRFGYFEMGWKESQRFLQPAYIMQLVRFGPDDSPISRTAYVTPAAERPVGELMPPLKAARMQEPRPGL